MFYCNALTSVKRHLTGFCCAFPWGPEVLRVFPFLDLFGKCLFFLNWVLCYFMVNIMDTKLYIIYEMHNLQIFSPFGGLSLCFLALFISQYWRLNPGPSYFLPRPHHLRHYHHRARTRPSQCGLSEGYLRAK